MPIYEYECLSKGHRFEELQKVKARPLQKCPVCGGKVRKLISSTAFHLKGGGWYKDGYASAKPGKASESGSSTSGTSESKSDSKTKDTSKKEAT
ncbi:MAG TPA: zinc ribbon domain-containing protein [Bdellovibrionota bacterium]|nr:zinc ribbon domain-containing protein [Bdellovibrionota bacterium]